MPDERTPEEESSGEDEGIESVNTQDESMEDTTTPEHQPETITTSNINIRNVPEETTATEREYIGRVIDLFLKIKHESRLPPHPEATSPNYSAQFPSFFDNITSTLNPDTVAGGLAVPGDDNEQVNFDMFFKFIHHPLNDYNICWAELKGYKSQNSINQLNQKYKEFLVKCYRSVNHLQRNHPGKYKFYFIASAPFSTTNWLNLKEPSYIRSQLEGEINYESLSEDKISKIANNICILIITWDMLEKVTSHEST